MINENEHSIIIPLDNIQISIWTNFPLLAPLQSHNHIDKVM